ncbi:MAG: M48 family metalloprotease [Thermodesulfobacteriota bacterium]
MISLFILKAWLFRQTIRLYQYRQRIRLVAEYFSVERNLVVLALILFGLDVYLLDLQYYLGLLPFSAQLPTLVDMAGIGVFLLYLVLLWLQLKGSYEEAVGVRKNGFVHIRDKLRIYIALLLPWLLVSFLHDLLLLTPNAKIQGIMLSPWGEPLFLLLMIVGAVIWFPALLVRLLGCTPMPAGELRNRIEQSCRRQGVRFGEICLWPIVEGKMLTAGVVGVVARYRYLMVTPALLAKLTKEELEAVVAHEIGHVRRYHLLLYLLLFLGFGILLQLCVQPLISLLLATRLFYEFLFGYEGEPRLVLMIFTGGPLIVMTLVYFRYIFGFFMRNFERQADLYSARVMGTAAPLISVFKKIALLSGNDRDMPCWHHFSIGQRIDYLLSCQHDANQAQMHNYKVYSCLAGYFVALILALVMTLQVGDRLIASYSGQKFAEDVILEKIENDPGNPLWHQFHGDLLVGRKQYAEAINAFELSLQLYPDNPETLNNLAWLLLTVEKRTLFDPVRALELAQRAVEIQARSHILDTLAEAYWQNGMAEMAIETAQRALAGSSGNRGYYRQQLQKFSQASKS